MWASSHGALAAMRFLVEEARVGVDARNKMGRTALMWACKYGRLDAARYLLHDAGADAMARMRDGSTAFDWAVFGGHRPTMELVADHPSVDLTALNRFGCAAVQWAAAAGSVDTCRWLRARGLERARGSPWRLNCARPEPSASRDAVASGDLRRGVDARCVFGLHGERRLDRRGGDVGGHVEDQPEWLSRRAQSG